MGIMVFFMKIIKKIKDEYTKLNKPMFYSLIVYMMIYMIFDIEQKVKGNILAFFIAVIIIFSLLQSSKISIIKTPRIFTLTFISIIITQTVFVILRMS